MRFGSLRVEIAAWSLSARDNREPDLAQFSRAHRALKIANAHLSAEAIGPKYMLLSEVPMLLTTSKNHNRYAGGNDRVFDRRGRDLAFQVLPPHGRHGWLSLQFQKYWATVTIGLDQ